MNYNMTSLGILVILIGFALVFIGALTQAFTGKSDTKIAVGGFIGFIPFGFGNDKRMVWALIALMAVALAFFFIMNFFLQQRIK